MAGVADTVARIATVVEGLSDGWKRSKQRISTFEDDEVIMSGLERKYWVGAVGAANKSLVNGSTMDHRVTIVLELSREFDKGAKLGKDYYTLNRAMADDAYEILDSLLHPNNWAYATTGLYLLEQDAEWEETITDIGDRLMVWTIELAAHIRTASAATIV